MKKWLWIVALAAAVSACDDDDNDNNNDGNGSLSLSVTDAPVDSAEAVVVSFVGVELLDAEDQTVESFDFDPPLSIDLLELQGSNSAFLIEDERVPPGEYAQVRLLLDTSDASCQNLTAPFPSYVTVDGTDYPLIVPSGGASGLKVQGPLTVAAGGTGDYVVDFDLRQSIAERGATGCYNLRPVLRVVDQAQVGTLAGTIDADLLMDSTCTADPTTGAGAAVYVYSGAEVVPDDVDGADPEPLTSALLTDQEGDDFSYEVGFLLAGEYTVALTCQAGDDDPEVDDAIAFIQPADVTITADTVTEQDFAVAAEVQ